MLNLVEIYFNNLKFKSLGIIQNIQDFQFLINDKKIKQDIVNMQERANSEKVTHRHFVFNSQFYLRRK